MRHPGDLIVKDPDADEPWGFDWSAFIEELGSGSAIDTSTWTITGGDTAVDPLPATVMTTHDEAKSTSADVNGVLTAGHFTTAYLVDGTLGRRYTVTNRIVTNNTPPVTEDRSFFVLIQEQ